MSTKPQWGANHRSRTAPPAADTGRVDKWDDEVTSPRGAVVRRKTPRLAAPLPGQKVPAACPVRCALDRATMRLRVSIDAGVVVVASGARAYAQHPRTNQITECLRPRPDEGLTFDMDVAGCSGVFFGLDLPAARTSYVAYLQFPTASTRWTQLAGRF